MKDEEENYKCPDTISFIGAATWVGGVVVSCDVVLGDEEKSRCA